MTDQITAPDAGAQANDTQAPVVAPATSAAPSPVAGAESAPAASSGGSDADLQAFREKLAGGDAAFLKQLERYKSEEDISKGFREAYRAAKAGGKPVELTDKSTPEEVKAYREAMGIPEDPTAYPVSFAEDFGASEYDTAILDDFKAAMHEKNVPPKVAAAALEWYQDFATVQAQELNAQLAKTAKETQAKLRAEWGGDYDGNIGAAQQLMKQHLGEDGFMSLMEMRLMDGSRLQDNLPFVKMMADLGGDYFGSTAIFTGDGEATGKTLEQQKTELLALRVSDPEKYKSDDVQSKLQRIYTQLDKVKSRS
jgi:hypothetical protein